MNSTKHRIQSNRYKPNLATHAHDHHSINKSSGEAEDRWTSHFLQFPPRGNECLSTWREKEIEEPDVIFSRIRGYLHPHSFLIHLTDGFVRSSRIRWPSSPTVIKVDAEKGDAAWMKMTDVEERVSLGEKKVWNYFLY